MAEVSKREVIVTRCPVSGASELVYQTGWLEEAYKKLDAEIVLLQSLDPSLRSLHMTQKPPLAFRDGGNVPPIWSHSNGTDTLLIGLSAVKQSHAIIVAPDSDIKTIEDLRGKRLALPARKDNSIVNPMRAMALRGYLTVLEAAGISRDEVTFVDSYPDEELEKPHGYMGIKGTPGEKVKIEDNYVPTHMGDMKALKEGTIDAFFSHRSLVYQVISRGYGKILIDIAASDLSNVNNIYPSAITVDRGFAEKNRDLVVAYLKELLKASDWETTHQDEAIRLGTGGQFGAEYEHIRDSRPEGWDERFKPSLDDDLVDMIRSQKDFLLKEGFIENDFSVDSWIDESYLKEAIDEYEQEKKKAS
ncbi:MAG: hypothetical protein J6X94_05125 [Lachnospiraceae bacterium]|nr:hypothetical protein [Lachnospiraceae bacterium]